MLGAVMLALGALGFALSMETSQKFLEWKVARSRAEAAALAAVLVLDGRDAGTEASMERVRRAAAARAGVAADQVEVLPFSDGAGLRVRLAKGLTVAARQREIAEPELQPALKLAAPKPDAADFGLAVGARYEAPGPADAGAHVGKVVAVLVHSGFPKEIPLTWIAGRVVATAAGKITIEDLGGYLRGARHGAVRPHGFYEATLGTEEGKP